MIENLFEKHLLRFLLDHANQEGNRHNRERLENILLRLIRGQFEGSSCIWVTDEDRDVLVDSGLVAEIGQTAIQGEEQAQGMDIATHPLVLFYNLLYLQKYYRYEARLARQVWEYARGTAPLSCDAEVISAVFNDALDAGEANFQKQAAEKALESPFTIVSGGPGTGKTTTVVRILALIQHSMDRKIDVALSAPTGKAAQRLYESIVAGMAHLPTSLQEKKTLWLPEKAVTLHRLLGTQTGSASFRHHGGNPLGYDIVLVDEASMVDLAMMSKLVDALKPGGRLILLGDKDQLASVESGTVLSTLVDSLPEYSTQLQKTYRFKGAIKELATAVNGGDVPRAWAFASTTVRPRGLEMIYTHYRAYLQEIRGCNYQNVEDAFGYLKNFMVLCGTRKGPWGVEGINRELELYFQAHGFAMPNSEWYPGRPIMVERNDYNLGLYNGDIGICLPDEDGLLRIYFEGGQGRSRSFLPISLSHYKTAYAMTIHKSQGSEFTQILLVLPEEDNRVLCRELIYTGITRAKEDIFIMTEQEIFEKAVSRSSHRVSGLGKFLEAVRA